MAIVSLKNNLKLVYSPQSEDAIGHEGEVAFDSGYIYLYVDGIWRRSALSYFDPENFPSNIVINDASGVKNGNVIYTIDYFYIYYNGWSSIALTPFDPSDKSKTVYSSKQMITALRVMPPPMTANSQGQDGNISYDDNLFYINVGKIWKKFPISLYSV